MTDKTDDPMLVNPSAKDLIVTGLGILEQRSKQYGQGNKGERSFERVAVAFNAVTGHDLKPSEVALVLQILKDVRQWTDMNKFHFDSAVDAINYSALKSELLAKEINNDNTYKFKT